MSYCLAKLGLAAFANYWLALATSLDPSMCTDCRCWHLRWVVMYNFHYGSFYFDLHLPCQVFRIHEEEWDLSNILCTQKCTKLNPDACALDLDMIKFCINQVHKIQVYATSQFQFLRLKGHRCPRSCLAYVNTEGSLLVKVKFTGSLSKTDRQKKCWRLCSSFYIARLDKTKYTLRWQSHDSRGKIMEHSWDTSTVNVMPLSRAWYWLIRADTHLQHHNNNTIIWNWDVTS